MRLITGKAEAGVLSTIFGMVVLLCCMGATVSAAADIPGNLVIQKTYRQGMGEAVGKVEGAKGSAFIMHSDRRYGYEARKGLPIYNGDTLFTRSGGGMTVMLNDDSKVSLSADTSLVINKSIYDAKSKSRLSFLEMLAGKARFVVTKLSDYKHSRFNVKTGSSVVGVRGSDFVIEQIGLRTVISALGETELQVFDPANPETPPVTVTSFQQLISAINNLGIPTNMTEAQIQAALEGLGFIIEDDSDTGGDDGNGEGDDDDDDPLVGSDGLESPEMPVVGPDFPELDPWDNPQKPNIDDVIKDKDDTLPDMPAHPTL